MRLVRGNGMSCHTFLSPPYIECATFVQQNINILRRPAHSRGGATCDPPAAGRWSIPSPLQFSPLVLGAS
eukprot:13124644-Heterocapsa_arctica.AAC.1